MSFGPYPKPNSWVQRKKASCWTHSPMSCCQIDWILGQPRQKEEHLPPWPHRISYTYNLLLEKSWASWLQSIHSPQINLGASNRYLGWDFKRCYLVSFNFEWDLLSNMWCTCSKWEWKEYFTTWIHPKKMPRYNWTLTKVKKKLQNDP